MKERDAAHRQPVGKLQVTCIKLKTANSEQTLQKTNLKKVKRPLF